jgi:hypothetical protein
MNVLTDTINIQEEWRYGLEYFMVKETILRKRIVSYLTGPNFKKNLSMQLEFIVEKATNTIELMYNRYIIKYYNLDDAIDNNSTNHKISDNIQDKDMIHSVSQAWRPRVLNESCNPTLRISMISLTKGVTL